MEVVDTNKRASLVCNRIADRPEPGVPSVGAVCRLCRAPVWVALLTLEMLARYQADGRIGEATIVCIPCTRARVGDIKVVVTGNNHPPGFAAAIAAELGLDPDVPVVDYDRGHRA